MEFASRCVKGGYFAFRLLGGLGGINWGEVLKGLGGYALWKGRKRVKGVVGIPKFRVLFFAAPLNPSGALLVGAVLCGLAGGAGFQDAVDLLAALAAKAAQGVQVEDLAGGAGF